MGGSGISWTICKSFAPCSRQTTTPASHWPLSFWPPYYRSRLWYTLSSVCLSSVTFCIVAKRYVLAKNCLKEWVGNQGQRFFWVAAIFLLQVSPLRPPRRPFCLIFARTAQWSVLDGTNGLSSSKPCEYCRIMRSELKPEVVLATIIDPERCSLKMPINGLGLPCLQVLLVFC